MCRLNGINNCLFGICNENFTCVCLNGATHDNILMKYANCGLPQNGLEIYASVALTSCILAVIMNFIVAKQTLKGSLLRSVTVTAVTANLCWTACSADLLISKKLSVVGIVFYVGAVVFSCLMFSFLFLSILLPVSKISRKIAVKFVPWRRFWLIVIPSLLMFGLSMSFFGAFFIAFDQEQFNNWISAQGLIFCFVVAIAIPTFTSFTGILIKGLKQALHLGNRMEEDEQEANRSRPPSERLPRRSSSTNDADFGAATLTRQLFVKDLLTKVTFIRSAVIVSGMVLFLLGFITFILQITLGSVPYFWVILVSAPFGLSLFSMQIAYYTRKRRENEKRRSTLVPILTGMGRQLSGIKKNSFKRVSGLFYSGNNVEGNKPGEEENVVVFLRQNEVQVPTTVKEEASKDVAPQEFSGSWMDVRNSSQIKIQQLPT